MAADASRSPRNTPSGAGASSASSTLAASTSPWNRISARARLASRRSLRALETCAHGRPAPCDALGGAPLPDASASRSSASDQSDSDAVSSADSGARLAARVSTGARRTPARASASSEGAGAESNAVMVASPRGERWRGSARTSKISTPERMSDRHSDPILPRRQG